MLRTHCLWLLSLLGAVSGCTNGGAFDPLDNVSAGSGTPPGCVQPDMAAASATCPASRGLGGESLLCVDFASAQTTLAALTAQGWDFTTAANNCPGWEIASGVLQVINFSSFSNGSCGLSMPATSASQIQQYKRLTLSLQQRIDLNDPEQQARIYLNSDSDVQNELWRQTGKKNVPRQQTTLTVDVADLPAQLRSSGFKWLFRLTSMIQVGRQGWQIESIAIHGIQ